MMDSLLNNKELLVRKCKMELDTIMGAIDTSALPNWEDPRDFITNKVLSSLTHRGAIHAVREKGSLRETTPYILSQILNSDTVKSWIDFGEEVKRRLPVYGKNPRALLTMCNLPWKIHFNIPEKGKRAPWGSKTRAEKTLPLFDVNTTTIKTLTDSFEAKVTELEGKLTITEKYAEVLEKALKDSNEEVRKLKSDFHKHIHVDGKLYAELKSE